MTTAQKNRSLATRFGFAWAGLRHATRSERSLRTQLLVLAGVLIGMCWLHPAAVWWALVVLISCSVIAAELFNTALEHLADHLHPEQHAQIRAVKDCAAAAVLVLAIGALLVAAALALSLWRSGPG
jgi:diacylglycerol kinase (ATP)